MVTKNAGLAFEFWVGGGLAVGVFTFNKMFFSFSFCEVVTPSFAFLSVGSMVWLDAH